MKAVLAAGAHFYTVELYGVVCIQMKVEALEKEGGVHAVGRRDGAGHRLVDPVFKAEDTCRAADELYGAACPVDGIGVRWILEFEGEGGGAWGANSRFFRYPAVCDSIGVGESWNGIEGALQFGAEFAGSVLAGREGRHIVIRPLLEGKHVPAGVDVIEVGGHAAIDELDAHHVFEGAAKGPAKGVGRIVGHEVAVTTIDGDSDGALLTVFAGQVRE